MAVVSIKVRKAELPDEAGIQTDQQQRSSYDAVITKEAKSFALQKSNEKGNGQQSNDEGYDVPEQKKLQVFRFQLIVTL